MGRTNLSLPLQTYFPDLPLFCPLFRNPEGQTIIHDLS
jgi:hypothetical protein